MSRITNGVNGHHGHADVVPLDSNFVTGLLGPETYPHPVAKVELVETHISWVLLAGEFAYKIKKPIKLGFLDFSELRRRRFYCDEEIRLNRFWAPEIYLDVVPIDLHQGHPRIGGDSPAIEYAVRMRRFDQSLRLDLQLESGNLSLEDMQALATEIADRHTAALRVPSGGSLLRATRRLMGENFDDLDGEVAGRQIIALRDWTQKTLHALDSILNDRCARGFYRECHGDLHLGNLVRLAGGIKAFDCIEFSEELRRIDVVADYGFLVMDFMARGHSDLAHAFLNRYLEITGDYAGVALLPMYIVYRCLVRAKVAAIRRRERAGDESRDGDTALLEHYVELALTVAKPRKPVLVAMSGLSASGKTWLSSRLVTAMPALRVRSDLERKRYFGLGETADSHSGIASGIYDQQAGQAVYGQVHKAARWMLGSGYDVILDAAFLGVESRKRAKRLAAECGADFAIVQASAPPEILKERLRRRAAAGKDASEADLAVLAYQLSVHEALTADELNHATVIDTNSDIDIAAVIQEIRSRAVRD